MQRTATTVIVVHCSATRANQDIGFDDIKRWHMLERAFMDIGYHWVIERDGTLKQGRGLDNWGAHCRGVNHESVGICLVGGLDAENQPEDNFTVAQKRMLKMLVAGLHGLYAEAKVKGHASLRPTKDCPCFDVAQWLDDEGLAVLQ